MKHPQPIGFDTDRYIHFQAEFLKKELRRSPDRLYIEFGGKIIQDRHSARVLPGYREDAKLEIIKELCRDGEALFVISAKDIARKRIRGDFGTTYDQELFRTLKELKKRGLRIRHIAISLLPRNAPLPKVIRTIVKKLESMGIQTHLFYAIDTYKPKHLFLEELEENPFVDINAKLILIMSPGGGSGKFGICINQLFHEMKQGRSPRYVKFETFPVHDLPVRHPLNLAFMAASADFYDVVMRDGRHRSATSYKRDIDNYELLHFLARQFAREGRHLRKISSATSMGMNMLSKGILDDELVQKEAAAEIARRLVRYSFEVAEGKEDKKVLQRVRTILAML